MIAIITAMAVTIAAILDYLLDGWVTGETKRKRVKLWLVAGLCALCWVQAIVQLRNDSEDQEDKGYLKKQLSLAMDTVKGMSDGGDGYPEPDFWRSDKTNTLNVVVKNAGDYPLRNVRVTIQNETRKIQARLAHAPTNPPC